MSRMATSQRSSALRPTNLIISSDGAKAKAVSALNIPQLLDSPARAPYIPPAGHEHYQQ